jgi:AcrR family transcriptional regulator
VLGKEVTPKDEYKEKVREAIKLAALDLAEELGWEGVSIRKIASRVGYAAPIVYEHFKNKSDLYHHLVSDGFHKLSEKTKATIALSKKPEEVIMSVANSRLDFARTQPTLNYLMFDADNPDWQKIEIMQFMGDIRKSVLDAFRLLSGSDRQIEEYFINFVCLVSGFTFYHRHLVGKENILNPAKTLIDPKLLDGTFERSIKRFIESIRNG